MIRATGSGRHRHPDRHPAESREPDPSEHRPWAVTTRSKLSEGLKEAFRQLQIEVSRPGK
jgi:hypothetical protein